MNPKSEAEAVAQYKPFVVKAAKAFASSGVQSEDLIQEGLIAVAVAFRTWRRDGGASFLTWIRAPVFYAMLKIIREHRRGGGSFRGGKRDGWAGAKGIWMKTTAKGEGVYGSHRGVVLVSLDSDAVPPAEQLDAESAGSLHEKIGSFEEPLDPLALKRLPDLLARLERRERSVVRLRFVKGLTYSEVGRKLKISRELARQLEQKALEKLKALLASGEEGTS